VIVIMQKAVFIPDFLFFARSAESNHSPAARSFYIWEVILVNMCRKYLELPFV
jgi:hypothetical protein